MILFMDFEMVVKKRRMCRRYSGEDVPQEKVDRILDMASRYPSAGHTEPQEFIVVRDQRVKEDLAHAKARSLKEGVRVSYEVVRRKMAGMWARTFAPRTRVEWAGRQARGL